MNRRDFMRRMFGLTVTIAVNPTILIPSPRLASDKLYGIDWGLNDATYGTWMGFDRSQTPMILYSGARGGGGKSISSDMIKLVKKLMDDALDKNLEMIILNDTQKRVYDKLKK